MCQNVVSELRLALMYLAAVCRACEIRVGTFIVNFFCEGRKTMNYQVFKWILLTVSALAMVTAGMCGMAYAQETCTCDEATFEILLDTYPESDCGEASMCRSMLNEIYKKTSVTDGETLDATDWGCVMKAFCGSSTKFEAPVALSPSDMGGASMWGFTALWYAVKDASGYHLDVSEKKDFSSFLTGYRNKSVEGTSQNVCHDNPGKTYYYRVRAYKSDGTESDNSNTVTVDLPLTRKPSVITRTSYDPFFFRAEWYEFACADGYLLDVSTESDFSTFFDEYDSKAVTGLAHEVNEMAPGVPYYWRIRAYKGDPADTDSLQVSDYSDIVKVTLPAPPEPEPRPPTGCYLSDNIVKEKAPAGTVVGTFTASSPNRKATHTFKLGYGDDDPLDGREYFAISGDTLKTVKEIPYNPVGYYVEVTTTNNKGLSRYDSFTIDILWAKEIYKEENDWSGGYKATYFYYLSKKDGGEIRHGKDTYQGPNGLIREYNYEDGLRHGTCTDYSYSDGKKYWKRITAKANCTERISVGIIMKAILLKKELTHKEKEQAYGRTIEDTVGGAGTVTVDGQILILLLIILTHSTYCWKKPMIMRRKFFRQI